MAFTTATAESVPVKSAQIKTSRPEAVIKVSGLVKTYGEVRAVDGIDFEVRRGTVFGLLGPNGAGKTTAVRVLTTLQAPTAARRRSRGARWSRTRTR